MRSCFSVLILAAGFVVALVWFGGPALAGQVVERSLVSSGFEADSTSVTVSADPPLELLLGHADRVAITARNAVVRNLTADRLALTLSSVDLVGRRFARVDGDLDGVTIKAADGPSVQAHTVGLRGRADAATVTIQISEAVFEALLRDAIKAQTGLRVSDVTLSEPDRIRFTAGLTLNGRFAVANGALVVAATSGDTRFTIFQPPPDLQLTSVMVKGPDLVIVGTTDVTSLLR